MFDKKKGFFFHLELIKKCNLVSKNLSKLIKKNMWPKLEKRHKFLFSLLQKHISLLSFKGEDNMALKLIDFFSLSTWIRIIAINKVIKRKGLGFLKLRIYRIILNLNYSMCHTKLVSFFSLIIDTILQVQLFILLNVFYEAKYPEYMFGSRQGRSLLNSVSFLYSLIKKLCNNGSFGFIFIKMNKFCFDFDLGLLRKYFIIPKRWKWCLSIWGNKLKFLLKNEITNISELYHIKFLIYSLILNVLFVRGILEYLEINFDTMKVKDKDLYTKKNRFIFIYNNLIIFLIQDFCESFYIIEKIKKALNYVGIFITPISYSLRVVNKNFKKKLLFNFLGFSFLLLCRMIKKNLSILDCYLYPSQNVFIQFKLICKKIIIDLRHSNFLNVLILLNKYLIFIANYFSCDICFLKLQQLDYFIFFFIKKYLIRKYRLNGIRRGSWVLKNFLCCNIFTFDVSNCSYFQVRHPFVLLVNNSLNSLFKFRFFFLIITSKICKKLPISFFNLHSILYSIPFYCYPLKFTEYQLKLKKKRFVP